MLKTFKIFALIILVFSIGSLFVFGQNKNGNSIKSKNLRNLTKDDFKILARGDYSKVDKPFVFVARDETSYAELKNLVDDLPAASTIDFEKNAVVAGFGGEKTTGGWSVEFRKSAGKVLVDINSPQKDMMVTQAITSPFKIVLIPVAENESLKFDLSKRFHENLQSFKVTKADFSYSGGFAGISKKVKASGSIKIMSYGNFATALFDLKGTGKDSKRKITEIATGALKDGNLYLAKLNSGTFVESPNPSLKVSGKLNKNILSLNFESLPPRVADGYTGKGSLEAKLIK